MCKAELADFTQEERESAAAMNSQAIEDLAASKGLVEVGKNSVPRQATEEGLPGLGCDVFVARANTPDGNDTAC